MSPPTSHIYRRHTCRNKNRWTLVKKQLAAASTEQTNQFWFETGFMWVRILKRTLFTQSLNGWMNECLPWTCERDSNHILTNNVQVRKIINEIKTITSLSRRASFNRHNKSVYVVEWMKLTYIILNFSSVHDFITNKSESFSLRSICLVENVVFFSEVHDYSKLPPSIAA